MRLAISNIAWQHDERLAVYRQLNDYGTTGLEIAPGLAFPDEPNAFEPSRAAISKFRNEVDNACLSLVSMQSLLFGVADAKLFGTSAERERFEVGLGRAVALAGRLGIPNLVMGSPGNRAIPEGLDRPEAERIAVEVFRRIADLCLEARTTLALEPNVPAYGTNFLNTTTEVIAFVRRVAHPCVSVNFDIGTLHMSGEFADGGTLFNEASELVSHIHVSEPDLAPAPADASAFERLARDIMRAGYGGWFSIEMRRVDQDNVAVVAASLARAAIAISAAKRP